MENLQNDIVRFPRAAKGWWGMMRSGPRMLPRYRRNTQGGDMVVDRQASRYVWLVTLRGELCLSPKKDGAKRVLDVGTGTGVWAIDYADAHPEAQGTPNCSFEVDDVEKDWTWEKPFDFIFGRVLAGCFSDYQAFIDKAFAALEPGGYLELQDVYTPWTSDDETLSKDSSMYKIGAECGEASRILGRPLDQCAKYKEYLANAGFVDIVERKFKWPLGVWPRDKYYKDIGQLYFDNIEANLEGLSMALLHRALGWTAEEVQTLCAGAREELRLGFIHAYTPV
ncbi:unnamed protein product [Parascedosporium putredinis]|uniref:Methyltransferase domain-containing protein n=1 Tax=Parascedosporium putredinis TaxID=1442378 RepID=A0A9P1H4N4_9PEZI|nr:unnamed protein product [Parascedosporium putredinis]CAI7996162.1 unnamed protein product [Parascedosporium putredinis]